MHSLFRQKCSVWELFVIVCMDKHERFNVIIINIVLIVLLIPDDLKMFWTSLRPQCRPVPVVTSVLQSL